MAKTGQPPAGRGLTTRLKTARGRTTSSQAWLNRQLNDPYVSAAQKEGYRSRAAFKLVQLDERFKLIKPGDRVVDLGAAPGGWTQVAVQRVGKGGNVLGVDINPMDPVPGATVIQLDFLSEGADRKVMDMLGGPVDVVLSDMASPATGHRQTDHIRIMALCEIALDFAIRVLRPGGHFACKVLKGGTENHLLTTMKQQFAEVKHAKPAASRQDSAESYVVALGFRGRPDNQETSI